MLGHQRFINLFENGEDYNTESNLAFNTEQTLFILFISVTH